MTTIPPNHIEIVAKGGGTFALLLNGHDLAPHINADWRIEPTPLDGADTDSVLHVAIPIDKLSIHPEGSGDPDTPPEAPAGYRYVQKASDKEPRLVKVTR